MLNNIGNSISPDQENVYYSARTLTRVLQGLITESKREALQSTLESFDRGVFVLGAEDLNHIIISIYQQPFASYPVSSVVITPAGITVSEEIPEAPVQKPVPDDVVDRASSIDLKESFHSNNNIKETTYKPDPEAATSAAVDRNIDIVANVKYWHDEEVFHEKILNCKILINIVKDKLQNLPAKTLEKYVDEYQEVEEEIDALISALEDASKVHQGSLGLVNVKRILEEIYQLESPPLFPQRKIETLITQAFYDFYNVEKYVGNPVSVKFRTRRGMTEENKIEFAQDGVGSKQLKQEEIAFSHIWAAILEQTTAELPEKKAVSRTSSSGEYTHDLLNAQGTNVFRDDGALDGWFTNNLYKKLGGEDLSFTGLENYTDNLREKTRAAFEYFNIYGGCGGGVLFEQAVYRAINDVCLSNMDVTSFSSNYGDIPISLFAIMGRSGILGPSNIFPAPDPNTQALAGGNALQLLDNDDRTTVDSDAEGTGSTGTGAQTQSVRPPAFPSSLSITGQRSDVIVPAEINGRHAFSNNAFLNFPILIRELQTIIKSSPEVRGWLSNNIGSVESSPYKIARDIVRSYGANRLGGEEMSDKAYHIVDAGATADINVKKIHIPIAFDGGGLQTQELNVQGRSDFNAVMNSFGMMSSVNLPTYLFHGNRSSLLDAVIQVSKDEGGGSSDYLYQMIQDGNEHQYPEDTLGISSSVGTIPDAIDNATLGFTKEELKDPASNLFNFYAMRKGNNLPHVLNSSLCLVRAIVIKTIENLIESFKDVMGDDPDVLLGNVLISLKGIVTPTGIDGKGFPNPLDSDNSDNKFIEILSAILAVVDKLIEASEANIQLFLNYDGTKTLYSMSVQDIALSATTRNTPGTQMKSMCRDYLEFVGKISKEKRVKLVRTPEVNSVSSKIHLPIEALADESNPNFAVPHGDASQYFLAKDLKTNWDRLQFTLDELIENKLLKKTSSILRGKAHQQWIVGETFVDRFSPYFRHLQLLTDVYNKLENFQFLIDQMQPNDKVINLFENGTLDSSFSLNNPDVTLQQIRARRNLYSANADGISKRYISAAYDQPPETLDGQSAGEVQQLYILGLKNDFFEGESQKIVPILYPIRSSQGIRIEGDLIEVPYIGSLSTQITTKISNAQQWLNYLHVQRGLDIGSHSFHDNQQLIYSELIRKNASGIFGWTKKDFDEDGVPTRPLDTLWAMSPWIFPRNYFYDVVDSGEYYKIAVGLITNGSLLDGDAAAPNGYAKDHLQDSDHMHLLGTVLWRRV